MNELPDDEFGPIIVRRLARARAITLSLNARGQPKLTAPRRTSLRAIERLINESRPHIRQLLAQHGAGARYTSGMAIGKQHSLVVAPGGQLQVRRQGCVITATVPAPCGAKLRTTCRGAWPRSLRSMVTPTSGCGFRTPSAAGAAAVARGRLVLILP